jgi:hypothetical protein
MIKGGTSAAGKTGAMRTGYTQAYIPCELFCYSKSVQAKLEAKSRISRYNALVKIENLVGVEQVLTSCSYFQVQKYLSSGMDSASLTIQKPEVWSIWGDQFKNLLKPSKRNVTILAGVPGGEIPIFKGRITGMSEAQGASGGAINLNCNDHRITLQRTEPTQLALPHSRYCEIHRLANGIFKAAGQVLVIADVDTIGAFTPVNDGLASSNQALSSKPMWVSGDLMTIGTGDGLQVIGTDILSVTDAAIASATRDFYDSSAFNSVVIQGLNDDGDLVTDEVKNDADVIDRGKIKYSSVVGTEFDSIDIARAQANSLIERALAGRFFASIVFNPYLMPGQVIKIQSNRFNITETTGRIMMVRHQYQRGDCGTWLDGLEVQQ